MGLRACFFLFVFQLSPVFASSTSNCQHALTENFISRLHLDQVVGTLPAPYRIGVGILIRDEQGRILLGRRTGPHENGSWGLPGGTVEAHQTIREAAIIETLEEAGLKVDITAVQGFVVNSFESGPKKGIHYSFQVTATVTGGTLSSPDGKMVDWTWFDPRELPSPRMAAFDRAVEVGLLVLEPMKKEVP